MSSVKVTLGGDTEADSSLGKRARKEARGDPDREHQRLQKAGPSKVSACSSERNDRLSVRWRGRQRRRGAELWGFGGLRLGQDELPRKGRPQHVSVSPSL